MCAGSLKKQNRTAYTCLQAAMRAMQIQGLVPCLSCKAFCLVPHLRLLAWAL